jgi:type 1 glutamine amidotransferase
MAPVGVVSAVTTESSAPDPSGAPTGGTGGTLAEPQGTPSSVGGASDGPSLVDNPAGAGGSGGRLGSDGGSAGSALGGASATGGVATGMSDAGVDAGPASRPARVLLYSFSTLVIPSVPAQLSILGDTLEGWGYEVEESVDPSAFTDESLAGYAAVGMINTCFSPFGENQSGEAESQALQRFLQQGGGLFGTHCADVTFQSANPPALYNQLLGGRASSQNFEGESRCRSVGEHPTTAALPAEFAYSGNLDGTDFIAEDSIVLVSCAWEMGAGMEVAVSWVRNEGAGRVFFTNFGKVDADLTDATIGDAHILSGLGWVLGR